METVDIWTERPPKQWHCPACGRDVFEDTCRHVLFVYNTEMSCFANVGDHFEDELSKIIEKRQAELDEQNEDLDDDDLYDEEVVSEDGIFEFNVEEDLEARETTNTQFLFKLEHHGFEHDGISYTYVGIDVSRED